MTAQRNSTASSEIAGEPGSTELLLSVRKWLGNALESHGAQVTGSGVGFGQADVRIVLDGREFMVSVFQTA